MKFFNPPTVAVFLSGSNHFGLSSASAIKTTGAANFTNGKLGGAASPANFAGAAVITI